MVLLCQAAATPRVIPRQAVCRREALASLSLALVAAIAPCAAATPAFEDALAARGFEEADAAWGVVLADEPANAFALANRGTLRLQNQRWAAAAADLEAAVELEGGLSSASPVAVNNVGNARAALGNWDGALRAYAAAADAPSARRGGLSAIARANSALALFQLGREREALATLRSLSRRDPDFWDARAASAAFLWAAGEDAQAEAAWATLCTSSRGFGAAASAEGARGDGELAYAGRLLEQQLRQQLGAVGALRVRDSGDDTPCRLYQDVATVRGRWPPRASAALDAFLRLSRVGRARGYDGEELVYDFGKGE